MSITYDTVEAPVVSRKGPNPHESAVKSLEVNGKWLRFPFHGTPKEVRAQRELLRSVRTDVTIRSVVEPQPQKADEGVPKDWTISFGAVARQSRPGAGPKTKTPDENNKPSGQAAKKTAAPSTK